MLNPIRIVVILTAGFVASSCRETPRPAESRPPIAVTVFTARYEAVPSTIEAPGSLQPRYRVVLSAQINGSVSSMKARAGDAVVSGQLLATLDAREPESQKAAAQAALNEALATLDEARKAQRMSVSMRDGARSGYDLASATLARYQKLFESRSVSPQELDEVRARREASAAELASREEAVAAAADRLRQVEARIAQARAQADRAEVVLGWTVIRSPIAGRVVERRVDPGSAIFPGTPLFVLETSGSPQVLADIPAVHAHLLKPGSEVGVRPSDGGPGVRGRISEVFPRSSAESLSIQFKVDLPPDFAGVSGQFVKVALQAGQRQAMLVPRRAVRETGQLTGVYVCDGARALMRLVKTAPFDGERLEVLSGIDAGEKVITNLTDQIIDGIPVEIRP